MLLTVANCTSAKRTLPPKSPGDKSAQQVSVSPTSATPNRKPPNRPELGDSNHLAGLLADSATREQAINLVLSAAERVQPHVLYLVSSLLYEQGKQADAVFWFHLAMLRAYADAERCTDATTRQSVTILNMDFGPRIQDYAYRDPGALHKTIGRVLAWDRAHPYDYDPCWISADGLGVQANGGSNDDDAGHANVAPAEPRRTSAEIIAQNRIDFEAAFEEAIEDHVRHRMPKAKFLWDKLATKADKEFILACGRDEPARVEALIARGANVNLSGEAGNNPLLAAYTGKRWDNFIALLAAGADPNRLPAGSLHYNIAAHLLNDSGDAERERYLKALFDHGLDPNLKDEYGYLIHQGVFGDNQAVLRLLLERGAKADVANSTGRYPIEEVVANGHCDEGALLFEHGARKGLERTIEGMDRKGLLKADGPEACRRLVESMKHGGIDIAQARVRGRLSRELESRKFEEKMNGRSTREGKAKE
jgi:ankyrin repeat protein